MSSAKDRIFMLSTHIQHTDEKNLTAQFPELPHFEKLEYLQSSNFNVNTNFSCPVSDNSIKSKTLNQLPVGSIQDEGPNMISKNIGSIRIQPTRFLQYPQSELSLEHDEFFHAEKFRSISDNFMTLLGTSSQHGSCTYLKDSKQCSWNTLLEESFKSSDHILQVTNHLSVRRSDKRENITVIEESEVSGIIRELQRKNYAAVVVPHLDYSTGGLIDIASLAEDIRVFSPSTFIMVDVTLTLGASNIEFEGWGLDLVLSESPIAFGCDKGVSLITLSQRFKEATQLSSDKLNLDIISALEKTLQSMTFVDEDSAEASLLTIERHRDTASHVRSKLKQLGLEFVINEQSASNTMTVVLDPQSSESATSTKKETSKFQGYLKGVFKEIRGNYLIIGHRGLSVLENDREGIDKLLELIEQKL